MESIQDRLTRPTPLLLDGATGSELHRRGVETTLPLWSAAALLAAPQVVCQIHADYVAAGAELVTANTFRTHARNLAAAHIADCAAELTQLAVALARQAAGQKAWVAGSQAPLEDCYAPDRVPEQAALEQEHRQMARHLADAGVDVVLVETHNTVREAAAAAAAVADTGVPLMVSFVCRPDGRLLSGQSLAEAVAAVRPFSPLAVLVNCVAYRQMHEPLAELLRAAGQIPAGAYGNVGRPDPEQGWVSADAAGCDAYVAQAVSWIECGARLVGGCCGTTPEHIRRLSQRLSQRGRQPLQGG